MTSPQRTLKRLRCGSGCQPLSLQSFRSGQSDALTVAPGVPAEVEPEKEKDHVEATEGKTPNMIAMDAFQGIPRPVGLITNTNRSLTKERRL